MVTGLFSQSAVIDTITMGAGYANEIYYSLPNDEQGSASSYNWDMAFTTSLMDASVRVNHAKGITIYKVTYTDSSGFSTLDTTGIATWPTLFNSDTSWKKGAFNITADGSNPFDFGWGTYNMTTHDVTGDSIYVARIAPPSLPVTWVKLFLKKKTSTNDYILRVAYLDNSFDQTYTVGAAPYATKNFIYVAFQTGIIDREPVSTSWDLTFNRYVTYIPGPGYYPVTGVCQNYGVTVAQAYPVDLSTVSVTPYLNSFNTNMSEIGYDWKYFDFGTNTYMITDSTAYFVKLADGNVWKMVFTGFESTTGKIMFSKELVLTNSVNQIHDAVTSVMVFPNPVSSNATLMFDMKQAGNMEYQITDVTGKVMSTKNIFADQGFQTHAIDMSALTNGIYFLTMTTNGFQKTLNLVVAR